MKNYLRYLYGLLAIPLSLLLRAALIPFTDSIPYIMLFPVTVAVALLAGLGPAILTGFLLVASPMVNRIIYAAEVEADMFGLDAAREPYGFATSAMRLGAYRKPEPGPLTNSCRNRPARGEGCSRWGQGRENPAMIRGQKSWGHSTGQGLPKHTDYVR